MICNAVRAERQGYDVFIVGHFQDSGLYEARSAVDIPVLALGEATMLYCCQLAQRSVIVTINPRFIPGFHLQLNRYGLRERVVDVAAMHFEPGQILGAFGDAEKTEAVCRLFEAQAGPLIEAGAELLLPGGGIPMLLFSGKHGYSVGGVPVVNGIEIVVGMAEMAARLAQRSGLRTSRRGTFEKAPENIVEEYLANPVRHDS
jgi:Asp/Glu/hydantoin racemase